MTGPVPNLFRIASHPDGFAGRSRNFADLSPYLLRNLERSVVRHGSPALRQFAEGQVTHDAKRVSVDP